MTDHKWNEKKGKRKLLKELEQVERHIKQLRAERKNLLSQLKNIE